MHWGLYDKTIWLVSNYSTGPHSGLLGRSGGGHHFDAEQNHGGGVGFACTVARPVGGMALRGANGAPSHGLWR